MSCRHHFYAIHYEISRDISRICFVVALSETLLPDAEFMIFFKSNREPLNAYIIFANGYRKASLSKRQKSHTTKYTRKRRNMRSPPSRLGMDRTYILGWTHGLFRSGNRSAPSACSTTADWLELWTRIPYSPAGHRWLVFSLYFSILLTKSSLGDHWHKSLSLTNVS